MYTVRPLCDHHCIPIFNLYDSFICEVNVKKFSAIFVQILELGTNATETIMPGTWSVLDPCLQNDITMVEVGQQCEPNTTLAADPKPGGLLTVEDKSASVWLCCSRYLLGEQLFRERGSSSECIHGLVRLNKVQWNKIYFTHLVQNICSSRHPSIPLWLMSWCYCEKSIEACVVISVYFF